MKKLLFFILTTGMVSIFSCKPKYPVPTFDKNRVKYFILEKQVVNDEFILNINDTTEFFYDGQGRVTKISVRGEKSDDFIERLCVFTYKRNHIIEKEYYHDTIADTSEYIHKVIYNIDENGNIIHFTVYDKDNNESENFSFEYNSENKLTAYYRKGEFMQEFYYENGNLIKTIDSSGYVRLYNYYDKPNNLSLYFFPFAIDYRLVRTKNYIQIKKQINSNPIKNIANKNFSYYYEYNADSLISSIITEQIFDTIPSSKDTVIQGRKINSYYLIVYE